MKPSWFQTGKLEGSRFNHDLSHEQILRIAWQRTFIVSRQYRQDRLRRKAGKLAEAGLLTRIKTGRYGDGHLYRISELGKELLRSLK